MAAADMETQLAQQPAWNVISKILDKDMKKGEIRNDPRDRHSLYGSRSV